jgi:Mn2+/Fe2+ NRAMP family transporter
MPMGLVRVAMGLRFNGVAAVPIMVMIMLMASRRQVMGQFTLTPWLMSLGWLATAL